MLSRGDFTVRDLDGLEVYSPNCTILVVFTVNQVNCISRFRRHHKNAKWV